MFTAPPREHEVVRLVALGKANKQIAYELGLSISTIRQHVHSAIQRLGVSNRMQAVITGGYMTQQDDEHGSGGVGMPADAAPDHDTTIGQSYVAGMVARREWDKSLPAPLNPFFQHSQQCRAWGSGWRDQGLLEICG